MSIVVSISHASANSGTRLEAYSSTGTALRTARASRPNGAAAPPPVAGTSLCGDLSGSVLGRAGHPEAATVHTACGSLNRYRAVGI